MRFNMQASLAKKYKGGDELHFTSLYSSYGYTDLVTIGGIYKYKIQGDHAISRLNGGAMYRIGDSYIAYAAVEAQRWSVGFTYDFIRSDVRSVILWDPRRSPLKYLHSTSTINFRSLI